MIKRLREKKVNLFGKKVSVFAIALMSLALVSAALLGYFGIITGNVTVSQGLFVDGLPWDEADDISYSATTTSLENPVILSVHYLDNKADIDAEVNFDYHCSATVENCDGITTKYYKTNLRDGSLVLSHKDGNWNPISGTDITVVYHTDVTNGIFVVDSITTLPGNYLLVYYMDKEFSDDGTRLITPAKAYVINSNFAIPYADDGNLKGSVNYCENSVGDDYDHCKGAKLWIIPESEINPDNTLKWSAGWRNSYYFENDLLGWDEYDTDGDDSDELGSSFIVPANSKLDFVIVSEFQKMMKPAIYTMTTEVKAA